MLQKMKRTTLGGTPRRHALAILLIMMALAGLLPACKTSEQWKNPVYLKSLYINGTPVVPSAPGGDVAWLDGSGVPDNATGNNGDYYLNDDNGDVYNKVIGSWSLVANIKGAQGDQGIQGIQGEPGLAGPNEVTTSTETDLTGFLEGNGTFINAVDSTLIKTASITFVIDGGGAAITTGQKGHLEIPFACTIQQADMIADQNGAVVVDVWKDTYANFPPTDVDSITSATPPTILAGNQKSSDSTLSSWTKTIAAGDILAFNVDSCTTITRVTLSLKVVKS